MAKISKKRNNITKSSKLNKAINTKVFNTKSTIVKNIPSDIVTSQTSTAIEKDRQSIDLQSKNENLLNPKNENYLKKELKDIIFILEKNNKYNNNSSCKVQHITQKKINRTLARKRKYHKFQISHIIKLLQKPKQYNTEVKTIPVSTNGNIATKYLNFVQKKNPNVFLDGILPLYESNSGLLLNIYGKNRSRKFSCH